jgi:protein-disulfide isomerase
LWDLPKALVDGNSRPAAQSWAERQWGSGLNITRRVFFNRTAALALSVPALAFTAKRGPSFTAAARAETEAAPNLMDPGPLPDRVLGSPKAPVTIIEYSSMTSSRCAAFAVTTFPDLKKKFIDTGTARYVARECPVDELAAAAAALIRSVSDDRYYPVMDALFRQQRQWLSVRIQPLMTLAVTQLGFTEESFDACLADQQLLDRLKQARDRAEKLGVSAMPTVFINGDKVASGYMTTRQMEEQIASHLKT